MVKLKIDFLSSDNHNKTSLKRSVKRRANNLKLNDVKTDNNFVNTSLTTSLRTSKKLSPKKKSKNAIDVKTKSDDNSDTTIDNKEVNSYLDFVQKSDEILITKPRNGRKTRNKCLDKPLKDKNIEKEVKSEKNCLKTINTNDRTVRSSDRTKSVNLKIVCDKSIDNKLLKNRKHKKSLENNEKVVNEDKNEGKDVNQLIVSETKPLIGFNESIEQIVETIVQNSEIVVQNLEIIDKCNENDLNINEIDVQNVVNITEGLETIDINIETIIKTKEEVKCVEKVPEIDVNTICARSVRRSKRVRKATELYSSVDVDKIVKQKATENEIKFKPEVNMDLNDNNIKCFDKTVDKTKQKSKKKANKRKGYKSIGHKSIGKFLSNRRNRLPDYQNRLKYVEKDPTIDILHKKLGLVSTRLSAIPESHEEY